MHFVTFYVLFYNISDLLSSAKASELPASSFQPAYLYDMLEVRASATFFTEFHTVRMYL